MPTPNADVAWPELKQSACGPVGVRSEPDCNPLRLRRIGAARMLWLMRSLPVSLLEAEMGPGPVLILSSQPGDETLGCSGLSAIAQAGGRPGETAARPARGRMPSCGGGCRSGRCQHPLSRYT